MRFDGDIARSCLDRRHGPGMVAARRIIALRLRRIMFVYWIALSVAVAPMASAWASMHAVSVSVGHAESISPATGASDAASDMADMADCHKAMKTSGDCPCCDSKAKCPPDAACMTKCCKVLGAALVTARLTVPPMVHARPAEPEKPPKWVSKPPSPPPRT